MFPLVCFFVCFLFLFVSESQSEDWPPSAIRSRLPVQVLLVSTVTDSQIAFSAEDYDSLYFYPKEVLQQITKKATLQHDVPWHQKI